MYIYYNNKIIGNPRPLPKHHNNILLNNLSENELNSLGWFKVNKLEPIYDNFSEKLSEFSIRKENNIYIYEKIIIQKTIEEIKNELLGNLKNFRDNYMLDEVNFNGMRLQTDNLSQQRLNAIYNMVSDNIVSNVSWRMADNINYNLNKETIIEMTTKVSLFIQTCFNVHFNHEVNIKNIESIEDLKNYSFTVGWPSKDL